MKLENIKEVLKANVSDECSVSLSAWAIENEVLNCECDNPEKDEPLKTLDGRYFTYYYDGFIAFVEY